LNGNFTLAAGVTDLESLLEAKNWVGFQPLA
jgi:hypothetical protein